jgi:hypothetical protein
LADDLHTDASVEVIVRLLSRLIALWVLIGLLATEAAAQTPPRTETAPTVSGGVAFQPAGEGGKTSLNKVFTPVVLVPFGEKWRAESRAAFEGEFEPGDGTFVGPVEKPVDYLELDYRANKYLTLAVGRFLSPLGIYSERFYPLWVRNLQTEPFILSLQESSRNGAIFRGGFAVNEAVVLNYTTYSSLRTTNQLLYADRQFGARAGVFLRRPRIEAGFSFRRRLQGYPASFYGAHFLW